MTQTVKYMDIAEFRALGYLQEVNRQFFHPLGLALEVQIDDEGNERLGNIWDYRDDPEGISFSPAPDHSKYAYIQQEVAARQPTRQAKLGYWLQPPQEQQKKEEEETQ